MFLSYEMRMNCILESKGMPWDRGWRKIFCAPFFSTELTYKVDENPNTSSYRCKKNTQDSISQPVYIPYAGYGMSHIT